MAKAKSSRRPKAGHKALDVQPLIEAARAGDFQAFHLIVGTEDFLSDLAVKSLRRAVVGDGIPGLNEDTFEGSSQLSAASVLASARTLPMMTPHRFVLVRRVELAPAAELAALAAYIESPSATTCLVLTAEKLDKRSKLYKAAVERGALAEASPLKGASVRRFAIAEATRRGHTLAPDAASDLVQAVGEDLAALDDALERLSLYVGERATIDADAVEACVSRVTTESIWALVDAIAERDSKTAVITMTSLLNAREPPLRVLALIARQLRIVARMRDALESGLRGGEAATAAGAPPFKARQLTESARRFHPAQLREAFRTLAETDLALKGSRAPDDCIMQQAVLELCIGRPRVREPVRRRLRTYR